MAAAVLFVGCMTVNEVKTVTLRCPHAWDAGGYIGFYSFATGEVKPPIKSEAVDLVYYFDNGDCFQGSLMGKDDRPGYIFPVGHKSWEELAELDPPATDTESIAAITPLTKEVEGLAFWVKASDGKYYQARIKSVQPASYTEVVAGAAPTVELEWIEREIVKRER
jgi:hypothetical protein